MEYQQKQDYSQKTDKKILNPLECEQKQQQYNIQLEMSCKNLKAKNQLQIPTYSVNNQNQDGQAVFNCKHLFNTDSLTNGDDNLLCSLCEADRRRNSEVQRFKEQINQSEIINLQKIEIGQLGQQFCQFKVYLQAKENQNSRLRVQIKELKQRLEQVQQLLYLKNYLKDQQVQNIRETLNGLSLQQDKKIQLLLQIIAEKNYLIQNHQSERVNTIDCYSNKEEGLIYQIDEKLPNLVQQRKQNVDQVQIRQIYNCKALFYEDNNYSAHQVKADKKNSEQCPTNQIKMQRKLLQPLLEQNNINSSCVQVISQIDTQKSNNQTTPDSVKQAKKRILQEKMKQLREIAERSKRKIDSKNQDNEVIDHLEEVLQDQKGEQEINEEKDQKSKSKVHKPNIYKTQFIKKRRRKPTNKGQNYFSPWMLLFKNFFFKQENNQIYVINLQINNLQDFLESNRHASKIQVLNQLANRQSYDQDFCGIKNRSEKSKVLLKVRLLNQKIIQTLIDLLILIQNFFTEQPQEYFSLFIRRNLILKCCFFTTMFRIQLKKVK